MKLPHRPLHRLRQSSSLHSEMCCNMRHSWDGLGSFLYWSSWGGRQGILQPYWPRSSSSSSGMTVAVAVGVASVGVFAASTDSDAMVAQMEGCAPLEPISSPVLPPAVLVRHFHPRKNLWMFVADLSFWRHLCHSCSFLLLWFIVSFLICSIMRWRAIFSSKRNGDFRQVGHRLEEKCWTCSLQRIWWQSRQWMQSWHTPRHIVHSKSFSFMSASMDIGLLICCCGSIMRKNETRNFDRSHSSSMQTCFGCLAWLQPS